MQILGEIQGSSANKNVLPTFPATANFPAASASKASIAYEDTGKKLYYSNGTTWVEVGSGAGGGGGITGGTPNYVTYFTGATAVSGTDKFQFNGTNVGIGGAFVSDTMLKLVGSDATSGNFALKVTDNVGANILNVRNDGVVAIGTASPISVAKFQVDLDNTKTSLFVRNGVSGATVFSIRNDSVVQFGSNAGNMAIGSGVSGAAPDGQYFRFTPPSVAATQDQGGLGQMFILARASTAGSGNSTYFSINADGAFAPTTGSRTLVGLSMSYTINQTGSTGNVIGIDYNPDVTAISGNHYAALFRTGFVGIGNSAPSVPLDVTGGIRFRTFNTAGNLVTVTDANGNLGSSTLAALGIPTGALVANRLVYSTGVNSIGSSANFIVNAGGSNDGHIFLTPASYGEWYTPLVIKNTTGNASQTLLAIRDGAGVATTYITNYGVTTNGLTLSAEYLSWGTSGVTPVVRLRTRGSAIEFHDATFTSKAALNPTTGAMGLNAGLSTGYMLAIKGTGSTSSTGGLYVTNNLNANIFLTRDDGAVGIGTSTMPARLNIASSGITNATQSLSLAGSDNQAYFQAFDDGTLVMGKNKTISSAVGFDIFKGGATVTNTNTGGLSQQVAFFSGGMTYSGAESFFAARAMNFSASNRNTGTQNQIWGGYFVAQNETAASRAYQIRGLDVLILNNSTAGTVFEATGIRVALPVHAVGSTITNTYGILIDDLTPTTAGTQTNVYSLYSSDVNARLYNAGSVGIGMTPVDFQSNRQLGITGSLNIVQPFDGAVGVNYGFRISRSGIGLDMMANNPTYGDLFGFYPVGSTNGATNTFAFRNAYSWLPTANSQTHKTLEVAENFGGTSYSNATLNVGRFTTTLLNGAGSKTVYGVSSNVSGVGTLTGQTNATAFLASIGIDQTGGSGVTRGFHAVAGQTLTVDYRAFEAENDAGIGFYQTNAAVTNRFRGALSIGTISAPAYPLDVYLHSTAGGATGSVRFGNSDQYGMRLTSSMTASGVPFTTVRGPKDAAGWLAFSLGTGDTNRVKLGPLGLMVSSGNIADGTFPDTTLHVVGDVKVTGLLKSPQQTAPAAPVDGDIWLDAAKGRMVNKFSSAEKAVAYVDDLTDPYQFTYREDFLQTNNVPYLWAAAGDTPNFFAESVHYMYGAYNCYTDTVTASTNGYTSIAQTGYFKARPLNYRYEVTFRIDLFSGYVPTTTNGAVIHIGVGSGNLNTLTDPTHFVGFRISGYDGTQAKFSYVTRTGGVETSSSGGAITLGEKTLKIVWRNGAIEYWIDGSLITTRVDMSNMPADTIPMVMFAKARTAVGSTVPVGVTVSMAAIKIS